MPTILPLVLVADELARLRAIHPLVHVMTNEVVQEITANVLLAAGASPAMIVAEEEVTPFAAIPPASFPEGPRRFPPSPKSWR